MLIKSILSLFAIGILGLLFVVLSKFQFGRNLLLKVMLMFDSY